MFPNRLRELREERKLLQKEAAAQLGIGQVTYNRYECAEREPDLETLMKIAKFFNVSTDYLLGNQTTSSSYYSFEKSEELISIYLTGIESWSNNNFLTLAEKRAIKSHFAEVLMRYKLLINKTVDSLMSWPDYKESMDTFYNQNRDKPTDAEIKNKFLQQELDTEIKSLAAWANAFPRQLSLVENKKEEPIK